MHRLGKRLEVQRCLRITLIGHIAADSANAAHRVTHMLLTAGQGPQRTPSAMSSQHVDPLSARSAQASVNHSASAGLRASVDSGASGAVPHGPAVLSASVGASAAPVERYHSPAAATQQQPQQPSLGSGVSAPAALPAASQPCVPPLPLASLSQGRGAGALAPVAPATSEPRVPLLPLASLSLGGGSAGAPAPAEPTQAAHAASPAVEQGAASSRDAASSRGAKLSWRELPNHQARCLAAFGGQGWLAHAATAAGAFAHAGSLRAARCWLLKLKCLRRPPPLAATNVRWRAQCGAS